MHVFCVNNVITSLPLRIWKIVAHNKMVLQNAELEMRKK